MPLIGRVEPPSCDLVHEFDLSLIHNSPLHVLKRSIENVLTRVGDVRAPVRAVAFDDEVAAVIERPRADPV